MFLEMDTQLEFHTFDRFAPDATLKRLPAVTAACGLTSCSRQWGHPAEITYPMKRQRLDILSHAEHAESNREMKDAAEAELVRRHSHKECDLPIIFVRKADGSLRLCIEYRGAHAVSRKYTCAFPRMDDTLDEL
jgi:hypothetical protein